MSFLLCCCSSCLPTSDDSAQSSEERQPLLQAESARLSRAPVQDVSKQNGRLSAKLVGVTELDRQFADIADTFNQQQEHYETMTAALGALGQRYGCSHRNGLSECLQGMRAEHSAVQLSLQMKGYDFTLVASGPEPGGLQWAQQQVSGLCRAAKAITAAGPRLQGMIGWALQEEEELGRRVRDGSPAYQEQRRVEANLRENLQAVRRVGELSARYRLEAGALFNEAAQLTTVQPQTTGAQTPAAQTAGAQTTGAQTPAAQTPAAQTPAAQTPGAQTAGAQTPAAQTTGAQTPATQTPGVQTPGAQTPGAQTPGP
ncbi:hypothetical protein AAFF_G00441300 [Aldrovandia affinis]|uniref:Uncharacterized protein n=1 Tax=Aldrovandia affinis TaxID=143900 RepID=A0AAD7S9L9_9TELE|nr:hypothetical protein AAFF_G00441300 [Aldrovandia affinis]